MITTEEVSEAARQAEAERSMTMDNRLIEAIEFLLRAMEDLAAGNVRGASARLGNAREKLSAVREEADRRHVKI